MKAAFAFILVIATIIESSNCNPSNRVRRQGWSWGSNGNVNVDRPQRPTRPPRPDGFSLSTSSTTSPDPNDPNGTTTTTASPQFRNCVAQCASTPQYNPVCGSNRATYDNMGKLNCARSCGLPVTFTRLGTC